MSAVMWGALVLAMASWIINGALLLNDRGGWEHMMLPTFAIGVIATVMTRMGLW